MLKKNLVIGVVSVLSVISLAACGSGNTKITKKSEGRVTIEYWHVNADTLGGKQ